MIRIRTSKSLRFPLSVLLCLNALAFAEKKDATGVASTKDISVGGFYMNTQANLPEGAILLVRIPLGDGRQIIANAEVVYSNPGRGVGLRFQSLSDDNRALNESELGRG